MKDKKLKVVAVIPARYKSTRFEGKPLAKICGKPMIYWVYNQTIKAKNVDEVFVATDDERIKKAVEGFGGKVVMTSDKHQTGTDRIAEAVENIDADIIVDVQGDEPLVHPEMIEQAVEPLLQDDKLHLTTLIAPISAPGDFIDSSVVKTVINKDKNIMFFSRSPIPYPKTKQSYKVYKQIGLYAFKKQFIQDFAKMEQTPLELIEGVELMRALENGYKVKGVETQHNTHSVDTISDLIEIEKIMNLRIKSGEL